MKANEFVKKAGWEQSIEAVKNVKPYDEYVIGIYAHEPREINGKLFIDRTPCKVSVYDLKRLIESYELVEAEGGLLNVKNSFQMERGCGGVDMTPFGKKLKQAIADVESCL